MGGQEYSLMAAAFFSRIMRPRHKAKMVQKLKEHNLASKFHRSKSKSSICGMCRSNMRNREPSLDHFDSEEIWEKILRQILDIYQSNVGYFAK